MSSISTHPFFFNGYRDFLCALIAIKNLRHRSWDIFISAQSLSGHTCGPFPYMVLTTGSILKLFFFFCLFPKKITGPNLLKTTF